jgi:hypothetical protein
MKCPKCGDILATQDWEWSKERNIQVHTPLYKSDPGYMHRRCLNCNYQMRRKNRTKKDMEIKVTEMLDINGPEQVEVLLRADHKVLWVNIEGICRLRVCNIQNFEFRDEKYPGE